MTFMPKVIPEYKTEARKKIIGAAIRVIKQKGYNATTMDDIAAHLGVSKGAIYLYFSTKDELLAAINQKVEEFNYEAAMRIFPKTAPLDAWTAFFDHFMSLDDQYNALFFELIAITKRNPEAMKGFSERVMSGIDFAKRGVKRQQEKGLINPDRDPDSLAIAITSMFIGMRSLVILGADRDEIRRNWIEAGGILLGPGHDSPLHTD